MCVCYLQVADQMAIAGGISCDVDPLLFNVMKLQNHCGRCCTTLEFHAGFIARGRRERRCAQCA